MASRWCEGAWQGLWGGLAEGTISAFRMLDSVKSPRKASRCPKWGGSKVPPKTAIISLHWVNVGVSRRRAIGVIIEVGQTLGQTFG